MKVSDLIKQINAYKNRYGDDVLNTDVCINNSFDKADISPLLNNTCILIMKDKKPTKLLFTLGNETGKFCEYFKQNNYIMPSIEDGTLYYINQRGRKLEIKNEKQNTASTADNKATKNIETAINTGEASTEEKKETTTKKETVVKDTVKENKATETAVKPVATKVEKTETKKAVKPKTTSQKIVKTASKEPTKIKRTRVVKK